MPGPLDALKNAQSIAPDKEGQWYTDHPILGSMMNSMSPVDPHSPWGPADAVMSIGGPLTGLLKAGLPLGMLGKMGGDVAPEAYDAVKGLKGLYSRLTDEIMKRMPDEAHPNKVLSLIKNFATPEEADMRGLTRMLSGQTGNVKKADVLNHLSQNPIQLDVNTLGELPYKAPLGVPEEHWNTLGADEQEDILANHGYRASKYSTYAVPGGQNYKETLIKQPLSPAPSQFPEGPLEANEQWAHGYQSPHWDDRNVLVHSRTAEHTLLPDPTHVAQLKAESQRLHDIARESFNPDTYDTSLKANDAVASATGPRGKLIENVQSDWHQSGSQHGYNLDQLPEGYKVHEIPYGPGDRSHSFSQNTTPYFEVHSPTLGVIDRGATKEEAITNALSELNRGKVPDAPFKSSWPDLALKHELYQTASDPNQSWIGVTPNSELTKRGEVMKTPQFQDQVLPSKLGRLLKPFGGEQGVGELPGKAKQLNWHSQIGRYGGAVDPATPNFEVVASHSGIDTDAFGNPFHLGRPKFHTFDINEQYKPNASFDTYDEAKNHLMTNMGGNGFINTDSTPLGQPGPFLDYVQKNTPTPPVSFPKFSLTPEMKDAIKKKGFPILSGLIGAGATIGSQQQEPQ